MNQAIKERIEKIKQGEVPEGYKLTESGTIPSSWNSIKLRKLASPIKEKVQNRKLEVLSITAGVGFVNQADKFGKEIAGAQYQNYTVLRKGDFSYNKGNSKTYPQGCIYMLEDRDEAAVPSVFNSFRFKVGIHTYYYKHLFINGFLNRQLYRYINAGVRNDGLLNLYDDDFYDCELPVPPLREQEKIAEILSTWDKAILLMENLIEEKKKQKKWLMQNLLNPDSGVRLPGFEGEWKTCTINEICTVVGGGTPDTKNHNYWNGDIPWISSSDLIEGNIHVVNATRFITKEAIASSATQICPKDSILVVSRVGVGKVAIAPYELCTSQDFTNLTNVRENVHFTAVSLSQTIKNKMKYTQGTSIKGITTKEIKDIILRFPTIAEQTAIAKVLTTADHEIELLEQKRNQLQKQKKALMQLLLTGIVRVTIYSGEGR